MDPTIQLANLKLQAEQKALKKLQTKFSSFDQVEQIERHLDKNEKRKHQVDGQLKSAMQSHFICVESCMENLKEVNNNLNDVKNIIHSINDEYKTIAHLETTLSELRREANRHKQLKAAKENVKNILNVGDLARQAKECIDSDKLLEAHKCLLDMEKCRNDILEEIGEQNDKNLSDIKLVEEFFKVIKEIQSLMHDHIFLTIKRMLEMSKSYPEKLVTVLRIIEREEILDDEWKRKREESNGVGFFPKDRPKNWRQECKNTIKNMMEQKIHGLRIEEREQDEAWFSKHLGNICAHVVPDLEIIKSGCEPCFPPSFKVFHFCLGVLHQVLSEYFKNLLDSDQLKDKEFYLLLSWLDTYKSEHFLGSPLLQLNIKNVPPLLDHRYFMRILEQHIDYTKKLVAMWFSNAVDKNVKEWLACTSPYTIEGNFESSLPNDINSMLFQQLQLIDNVNDERFSKATLQFLIEQLNSFIDTLKDKILEFKVGHFKNTALLQNNFTIRMITISNDCIRLKDTFLNIRNTYDKHMDKDEVGGPNDLYETMGVKISQVSSMCLDIICEDMLKYLDEKYFMFLLSKEWLTDDSVINTIISTSNDYMADLIHLRPESLIAILVKWHNRIKAEYMKGFLQNLAVVSRGARKCQFDNSSERKLFGSKMNHETALLDQWFSNMTASIDNNRYFDFNILVLMTKIIKADDVDFIGVEIGALIKRCPDITSEILYGLLLLRGDVSRSDFRDKYEDYVITNQKMSDANKGNVTSGGVTTVKTDPAMKILKKELKI